MEKENILNELRTTRNLSTPEEEIRFYNAVDQLEYRDNSLLPDILYLFKDDVPNPEPFKDLAKRIATLDDSLMIKYLVECIPDLIHVAQEWMVLFYMSLLDENLLNEWIDTLQKSSPAIRAVVFNLFDEIEKESWSINPLLKNEVIFYEKKINASKFIRGAFQEE